MASKYKNSKTDKSGMPKKRCKVLPLCEKVCMYREKHSIYGVPYYQQFQASAGDLGPYPPIVRTGYCINRCILRVSWVSALFLVLQQVFSEWSGFPRCFITWFGSQIFPERGLHCFLRFKIKSLVFKDRSPVFFI